MSLGVHLSPLQQKKMLHSTNFHTLFCSISPLKNPNSSHSSSSSSPHLLKFRISHRENLRYLKTLGVISPEAKLHKYPSPETLSQILSTVNYLKSKGFSDPDFSRLAYLCPGLFSPDFSPNDVEPVFDFLATDLSASAEQSCALLLKCPHILESNVEFCLKPTLVYLSKLGIENLNTPTTLNAHLLNTRVEKFEEKIRFLRRIGLTYEEAAKVCGRLPAIFGYSIVNNLGPKYEYLVKEMKMGVEEVRGFPQYFAFSLEKRIVPRHLHLKERNVEVPSLNRMLLWSDRRFYAKWK